MRQARAPPPPFKKNFFLFIIHPLHLWHFFSKKDEDNKCSVTDMPSGGFEIPWKRRKTFPWNAIRNEPNSRSVFKFLNFARKDASGPPFGPVSE